MPSAHAMLGQAPVLPTDLSSFHLLNKDWQLGPISTPNSLPIVGNLLNMDDFYNNETLEFLYSKTLCPLYLSCPVSQLHLECSTSAHLLLDCT